MKHNYIKNNGNLYFLSDTPKLIKDVVKYRMNIKDKEERRFMRTIKNTLESLYCEYEDLETLKKANRILNFNQRLNTEYNAERLKAIMEHLNMGISEYSDLNTIFR